jgi:hypothetical protein
MYRQPQSPPRRQATATARDDAELPHGECRYILLHPEVKGQRCACVGFALNRSTPGSSCDCGHQACYHLPQREDRLVERAEIESLKHKISRLEEILDRDRYGGRNSLTSRLSGLEELVDKCKGEMESEIKTAYRGIEGLWNNVGKLQKQAKLHDDRIDELADANHASEDDIKTLQTKLIDIDDVTMQLEERLDAMVSSGRLRSRRKSPSDPNDKVSDAVQESEDDTTPTTSKSVATAEERSQSRLEIQSRDRLGSIPTSPSTSTSSKSASSDTWTVHISLLPKASQPFPFEKDTSAYKRCLSRGLHRVVVITGRDYESFTTDVSKEFLGLLKGRPWMPLVAKICDAENLIGLPMLRQLPANQINSQLYDHEFLKNNCATVDVNGKILALYIAMCADTFSWSDLEYSAVYAPYLEASWEYDPFLDGPRLEDDAHSYRDSGEEAVLGDDRPSAGDLLRGWSPPTTRLKRTASAISRTSSFGSADGESKRAKMQQRQCAGTPVDRVGRRAEAV